MKRQVLWSIGGCAAALVMTASDLTQAGGFYVREQSTSALATANAGAAAHGADASHMFFNPATILDAPGTQLTIDARGFFANARINATAGTAPLFTGGQNITALGDSGEMTDPALAPSVYGSIRLNDQWAVGLGISSPFAVVIETDPLWAGHFQLTKTDMTTVNINPVIAYQVSPELKIAAGLQIQHFDADLRKTEALPIPFVGFLPAEGFAKGDGFGYGATAGLIWQPNESVSLGLSYRSHIKHKLKGTAGAFLPGVPEDGIKFDVTTPEIVALAIKAQVTERLTLQAQAEWAGWSRFDGFRFRFASGRPDEVRPQDWRDTWFAAVGLTYALSDATDVSFGVNYDQAASESADNTLSPDGDRTMIALGISHKATENLTLRASYAHMFIDDAAINVANLSGTLNGNFESELDIIGVSASWRW